VAKLLDRLNPSNASGTAFVNLWRRHCEKIESLFEGQQAALDALADAVAAIAAAQAAADAANAAAAAADTAASNAQTTADGITDASALANSYCNAVLTASDAGSNATISIAAHTRYYPQPDGTTVNVSVNSGSVTARPFSTFHSIYYDDPGRAGGAVTYHATTDQTTAAQIGDRHCVGGATTPADGDPDSTGTPVRSPGAGTIDRASTL
jgi:hypothetical protein